MFRYIIAVCLLFLAGCSTHSQMKPNVVSDNFEQDTYMLVALDASSRGKFHLASSYYQELYGLNPLEEYRENIYINLLLAQEYTRLIVEIDDSEPNSQILRFKIKALVALQRLREASELSVKLAGETKSVEDYQLTGSIFTLLNDHESALKYYESAYAIDQDEQILNALAVTLYVNLQRKKEAIAQLETHSRIRGCSELICGRLAGFYSDLGDIDGMLNTYLRLFKSSKDEKIAAIIAQLYEYRGDIDSLEKFVDQNPNQREALLRLLSAKKEYKRASEVAFELYESSGSATYLAQSAIFLYELEPIDKRTLQIVIRRLSQAVRITPEPMFLNYLGYTMIEHGIDVERAMEYVKEALLSEPDSSYYLDSLAWGYYMLGECETAKSVIDSIKDSDPEIKEHKIMIDSCIEDKEFR